MSDEEYKDYFDKLFDEGCAEMDRRQAIISSAQGSPGLKQMWQKWYSEYATTPMTAVDLERVRGERRREMAGMVEKALDELEKGKGISLALYEFDPQCGLDPTADPLRTTYMLMLSDLRRRRHEQTNKRFVVVMHPWDFSTSYGPEDDKMGVPKGLPGDWTAIARIGCRIYKAYKELNL